MATTFGLFEAKNRLSELVDRAARAHRHWCSAYGIHARGSLLVRAHL